jgi:hypothetical protein
MGPEVLSERKISIFPSVIEPETFRLVAQFVYPYREINLGKLQVEIFTKCVEFFSQSRPYSGRSFLRKFTLIHT